MTDDTQQEIPVTMEETPDDRLPAYPEGILDADPVNDPPHYIGDLMNLTERRNTKLFNVWTVWSDLRRNEQLIKMLEAKKKDSDTLKYLKGIITCTIDRLGKMLSDTNIVEELFSQNEIAEVKEDIPADKLEH